MLPIGSYLISARTILNTFLHSVFAGFTIMRLVARTASSVAISIGAGRTEGRRASQAGQVDAKEEAWLLGLLLEHAPAFFESENAALTYTCSIGIHLQRRHTCHPVGGAAWHTGHYVGEPRDRHPGPPSFLLFR